MRSGAACLVLPCVPRRSIPGLGEPAGGWGGLRQESGRIFAWGEAAVCGVCVSHLARAVPDMKSHQSRSCRRPSFAKQMTTQSSTGSRGLTVVDLGPVEVWPHIGRIMMRSRAMARPVSASDALRCTVTDLDRRASLTVSQATWHWTGPAEG